MLVIEIWNLKFLKNQFFQPILVKAVLDLYKITK